MYTENKHAFTTYCNNGLVMFKPFEGRDVTSSIDLINYQYFLKTIHITVSGNFTQAFHGKYSRSLIIVPNKDFKPIT